MFGKDIYTFLIELQKLGFSTVLVIGEPGTGKSTGMKTLEPDTNLWFNTDNKNPVWKGGREQYGTKRKPIPDFHVIPRTYMEIIKHIKSLGKEAFIEEPIAFLTGHCESYKSGFDTRERLKTIGQVATKMQLEGKLEHVFYSKVEVDTNGRRFLLTTQNSGYNTARSPEEMLPDVIPNDYKMIVDAIHNY